MSPIHTYHLFEEDWIFSNKDIWVPSQCRIPNSFTRFNIIIIFI
nr:MAG TPA: hypothetical protein [Caudoviricetes sp.]